jgi:GntR family transcriptional regulator/MocR family aminotransferase
MAHRLAIRLDVFASTPLYQQLAKELRRLIDGGLVAAGERLPSLRDLSKQLQISVITVRQAIDILLAEQYIVSKPGSGNFVSEERGVKPDARSKSNEPVRFVFGSFRGVEFELPPHQPWSSEAAALTESFNSFPFHPWWDVHVQHDFRAYQPSAEFLRGPRWDKSFASAAREITEYPQGSMDAAGLPALREQIAEWLNRSRQLGCHADDIIVVSGAQQAREILARLFVTPSRKVIVEEPGSITDILAYATKGGELLHILQQDDGIDTSALQAVSEASVIHLITASNFPTGITISEAKRHAVIDWASRTGSLIVEDAYGAGFNYQTDPFSTIYTMAAEAKCQVAYVGSLSQFTSPALRIGFIVARSPLRDLIVSAKRAIDHHTSLVSQQMALTLFNDGFFDEHYLRLMKACRARRETMLEELGKWPGDLISFKPVSCGFQQSVWFKQDIDDLYVFEQALKSGLGVIPLSPYFHATEPRHGLSLNFARNDEDHTRHGLHLLLQVVLNVRDASGMAAIRE